MPPTSQVNPNLLIQALRQRAAAAGAPPGLGTAPNTMNGPAPTPPPTAPQVNVGGRATATPTQQLMKGAAQAQSPLMDPQTRQIAKSLIQKLMQHI